MAVDSYDSTTGRPIFTDGGAPDIGVDPTAVGIYAADVGNKVLRANLAALGSYSYKRAGLRGDALDTGIEYRYSGSGWEPIGGKTPVAVLRRTSTALVAANGIPSGTYTNLSATAAWTATGGEMRGFTFDSSGLTCTVGGLYWASWALWVNGTPNGVVGIAVNGSSPTATTLHALSHIYPSIIATGAAGAPIRLASGDKLTLWGIGNGAGMDVRATPSGTEPMHWGARWIAP